MTSIVHFKFYHGDTWHRFILPSGRRKSFMRLKKRIASIVNDGRPQGSGEPKMWWDDGETINRLADSTDLLAAMAFAEQEAVIRGWIPCVYIQLEGAPAPVPEETPVPKEMLATAPSTVPLSTVYLPPVLPPPVPLPTVPLTTVSLPPVPLPTGSLPTEPQPTAPESRTTVPASFSAAPHTEPLFIAPVSFSTVRYPKNQNTGTNSFNAAPYAETLTAVPDSFSSAPYSESHVPYCDEARTPQQLKKDMQDQGSAHSRFQVMPTIPAIPGRQKDLEMSFTQAPAESKAQNASSRFRVQKTMFPATAWRHANAQQPTIQESVEHTSQISTFKAKRKPKNKSEEDPATDRMVEEYERVNYELPRGPNFDFHAEFDRFLASKTSPVASTLSVASAPISPVPSDDNDTTPLCTMRPFDETVLATSPEPVFTLRPYVPKQLRTSETLQSTATATCNPSTTHATSNVVPVRYPEIYMPLELFVPTPPGREDPLTNITYSIAPGHLPDRTPVCTTGLCKEPEEIEKTTEPAPLLKPFAPTPLADKYMEMILKSREEFERAVEPVKLTTDNMWSTLQSIAKSNAVENIATPSTPAPPDLAATLAQLKKAKEAMNEELALREVHHRNLMETLRNDLENQAAKDEQDATSSSQPVVDTVTMADRFSAEETRKADDSVLSMEKISKQVPKNIRAILNKITRATKDALITEFLDCKVHEHPFYPEVIALMFEKAVDEPKFCALYAEICREQVKEELHINNGVSNFRNALLIRAQETFQGGDHYDYVEKMETEIENETDGDKKMEKAKKLHDAHNKFRKRKFGNILFTGQLYLQNLISVRIILFCAIDLLKSVQDKKDSVKGCEVDEEAIECAILLLEAIGKKVEEDNEANRAEDAAAAESGQPVPRTLKRQIFPMDKMFETLEDAMPLVSSRIKFMIMDLVEFRNNGWEKPKKAKSVKPKRVDEVKKEVQNEQKEKKFEPRSSFPLRRFGNPAVASIPTRTEFRIQDMNRDFYAYLHGQVAKKDQDKWWETFGEEFFEDNAVMKFLLIDDEGKTTAQYVIGRHQIPQYFRTVLEEGMDEFYYTFNGESTETPGPYGTLLYVSGNCKQVTKFDALSEAHTNVRLRLEMAPYKPATHYRIWTWTIELRPSWELVHDPATGDLIEHSPCEQLAIFHGMSLETLQFLEFNDNAEQIENRPRFDEQEEVKSNIADILAQLRVVEKYDLKNEENEIITNEEKIAKLRENQQQLMAFSYGTRVEEQKREILMCKVQTFMDNLKSSYSPSSIDDLTEEFLALKVHESTAVEVIVAIIFEQAIDEPEFAEFCASLFSSQIAEIDLAKKNSTQFRNVVLRNARETIMRTNGLDEILKKKEAELSHEQDKEKKMEKLALVNEMKDEYREKIINTHKFIGHLYLNVPDADLARFIKHSISQLLSSVKHATYSPEHCKPDEEALEVAVWLLEITGPLLHDTRRRRVDSTELLPKLETSGPFTLTPIVSPISEDAAFTLLEAATQLVSPGLRGRIEELRRLRDNGWERQTDAIDQESKIDEQLSDLYWTVLELLDSLTERSIFSAIDHFLRLKVHDSCYLNEIVLLFFDQAIERPHMCELYARLCEAQVATENDESFFHSALIERAEAVFDARTFFVTRGFSMDSQEERRRKKHGSIAFIAQLYAHNVLFAKHIGLCSEDLLKSVSTTSDATDTVVILDEEAVECALRMFEVCIQRLRDDEIPLQDTFEKLMRAAQHCSERMAIDIATFVSKYDTTPVHAHMSFSSGHTNSHARTPKLDVSNQTLLDEVRELLSKVTPTSIDNAIMNFLDLKVTQALPSLLEEVVNLIFDKANEEPYQGGYFARLCAVQVADELKKSSSQFRNALLVRAQSTFTEDSLLKLETSDESRKRKMGNIRFIGHLFVRKLISTELIVFCFMNLLTSITEDIYIDQEAVECALRLLEIIVPHLRVEEELEAKRGSENPRQVKFPLETTLKTLQSAIPVVNDRLAHDIKTTLNKLMPTPPKADEDKASKGQSTKLKSRAFISDDDSSEEECDGEEAVVHEEKGEKQEEEANSELKDNKTITMVDLPQAGLYEGLDGEALVETSNDDTNPAPEVPQNEIPNVPSFRLPYSDDEEGSIEASSSSTSSTTSSWTEVEAVEAESD